MDKWLPYSSYESLVTNKFAGHTAQEIYAEVIKSDYLITAKDGTSYRISLSKLEETLGEPYLRTVHKAIEW
jgi:hypothetical protein